MKIFSKTMAALLCLIMVFSLCACGGDNSIVGSWKTRPQVDENGEVIEIPDKDVLLFTFESDGTGNQSQPEYGETVIMDFDWSVSGETLTLRVGDTETYKFTYKIKKHVLTLIPSHNGTEFEYIRVS